MTPLDNDWNHFIRFDTGDVVHLEESGKCACGRNSGLILDSVKGRQANLTLTCAGRLVTLFELDNELGAIEDIDAYQLVQPDIGNYRLRIVCQNADEKQLYQKLRQTLKNLYGNEAKIDIMNEKDIAPEISGKYLLSKALFPLVVEDYLDQRYFVK